MELPRITVVFRFRQCDNENQAGREGPLLTAPAKALICWRPFTLRKSQLSVSNGKRILLCIACREPSLRGFGRFKTTRKDLYGWMAASDAQKPL